MKDMENYRLSSYTNFTKLEDAEDRYMLVHGYTGAIDVVTEKVVSCLKAQAESLHVENVCFSHKTFDTLVKRGYITQRTSEEEIEYVGRLANILHRKYKMLYKHFLFVMTYDCNFRCPYCYENGISGKGRNWSGKTFTREMVDKAYLVMLQIEPERKLHHNVITLYGGEPLLKKNKDIVEYVVYKGNELGYEFSAITNGYDLDVFQHLLAPNLIKSVQITLDGDEEQHNERRIHRSGVKTFDRIVNNIEIALKAGISVVVRMNTDMSNFDKLKDLKYFFDNKGYTKNDKFSLYSSLLLNYEQFDNNVSHFNYGSYKEFNKKHKLENYNLGCYDRGLFSNLNNSIKNNKLIDFRSIYCAAQSGEYLFDPYGDIYPCWDVLGNKQHIIGNYAQDPVVWTDVKEQWHNRNVSTLPSCRKCKFALLCQGGCAGSAWRYNNSIETSFCENYADILEMSINRVYKSIKNQMS